MISPFYSSALAIEHYVVPVHGNDYRLSERPHFSSSLLLLHCTLELALDPVASGCYLHFVCIHQLMKQSPQHKSSLLKKELLLYRFSISSLYVHSLADRPINM